MPLFFAVNGYAFGMAFTSGTLRNSTLRQDALRNKCLNMVIIYIFYSLVMHVLRILFPSFVINRLEPLRLLLLWVRPIPVYWYVYVLVIYYLLFGINRIRNASPWLMSGLLAGISVLSALLPGIPWLRLNDAMFNIPFFYFGYCLQKESDTRSVKYAGWAICGVTAILAVFFWRSGTFLRNIPMVGTVVATGCVFAIFTAFRKISLLNQSQLLIYCGHHRLEVYLLHTYVLSACRAFLPWIGIRNYFIHTLISSLAGLLLPMLVGYVAEKLNLRAWLLKPYTKWLERKKD